MKKQFLTISIFLFFVAIVTDYGGYFTFTFFVALIFSLWLGLSIIKNRRKVNIFLSFFIPIFIYGGLIVYTAWGQDGLVAFFAFILTCIALSINYVVLIVDLWLKPSRRMQLIIVAIASFFFLSMVIVTIDYVLT